MTPIEDAELVCPRCGRSMVRGYINGGKGPVRWVTRKDEHLTVFGGERLVPQHWIWGRHVLPAARCVACHIGLFSYDT